MKRFRKFDIENRIAVKCNDEERDFPAIMKIHLVKVWGKDQELTRSYLLSYPMMCEYFHDVKNMTAENFTRGIFMIYGWMPTVLYFNGGAKFDFGNIRTKLSDLQQKSGKEILENELKESEKKELGKKLEEKSRYEEFCDLLLELKK